MNTQKQLLRIEHVRQVNPWVRCFRLVSAEGKKLASFLPGQYLNLFYEIDGTTTSRPYSIASSPQDAEMGFYELYIHGGGPFTAAWLFRHGLEGTTIRASMPMGDFHHIALRDGQKVIGISGGMSVTPLHSMARAVAQGTLDVDLTLFCGWDSAKEVLFRDEFEQYMAQSPKFHAIFAIDGDGAQTDERGYVTLEMIRRHVAPEGAAFFICGPNTMYQPLAHELSPLNIPAEKYHQELPGEIKLLSDSCDARTYILTVVLEGTSRQIPMNSQETVLVAMERAGLAPEARCRSGHCGFCIMKLEEGTISVPEMWDERAENEKQSGLIHPCCSFPCSDLYLSMP